jgi:hypothetical protein
MTDTNDSKSVTEEIRREIENKDHDWELKGGTSAQYTSEDSMTGVTLWQCRDCNVSASRRVLQKYVSSRNAVIDPPDVEVKCPPEKETT